jgi:hypothetical protein
MEPPPPSSSSAARAGTRETIGASTVNDQPTKDDQLGFGPYVEAIAAFLMHKDTRPPLTLSVEGEWGSGKSSFMLQLEERLGAMGAKTVWFNAWRHDKEEELWAAFAVDFTNKLAARAPRLRRWLLHLKLGYLRFDWRHGWFPFAKSVVLLGLFVYLTVAIAKPWDPVGSPLRQFLDPSPASPPADATAQAPRPKLEDLATLLIGVGGTAGYLLLGLIVARKVGEIVGNPLQAGLARYVRDPRYKERSSFIDTFHCDFDRLVRTYAGKDRVVVFVDDLDRCEVPKAAELMQALNLLISESAPVYYVLGLDRAKIAAGLAAKYEKLLPYLPAAGAANGAVSFGGSAFGYAYLEKFIQLPFMVPRPTEMDVDKLLDSLGAQPVAARPSSRTTARVEPGLLVELSTDSAAVRAVVKMVAPALDYNPRRLKQFVNLFRLRALLASQTGLFGSPRDRDRFDKLTFGQLGKLVAIMLRWPLLLIEVDSDPSLLSQLQERAWHKQPSPEPADNHWVSDRDLMRLLSFPWPDGLPQGPNAENQYSLARVDIDRFLAISPVVGGRESGSRSTTQV